jgi:Peroxidase, family 2
VEKLIADSSSETLSLGSLAKSRVRRDADSLKSGAPVLESADNDIALNEATFILQGLGVETVPGKVDSVEAPKKAVKEWFLEETFPEGYTKPEKAIDLDRTVALTVAIKGEVEKVKGA